MLFRSCRSSELTVPSFADDVLRKNAAPASVHQCVADGQTVPLSLFRWCNCLWLADRGAQHYCMFEEGKAYDFHLKLSPNPIHSRVTTNAKNWDVDVVNNVPVSYTHLDVYKRQELGSSIAYLPLSLGLTSFGSVL